MASAAQRKKPAATPPLRGGGGGSPGPVREVPTPEPAGEASAAGPHHKPFSRKRAAPDASTPEAYRVALAYEGRTDERTFRSVAARTGCAVSVEEGRIVMRAGRLLMGRCDPRTGRAETRHDYPHPAPLPSGHWEIEVRDDAGDDGLTPFAVRWTGRARGTPEEAYLRTDLGRFVDAVGRPRSTVGVTGHDGTRKVVTVATEAWRRD